MCTAVRAVRFSSSATCVFHVRRAGVRLSVSSTASGLPHHMGATAQCSAHLMFCSLVSFSHRVARASGSRSPPAGQRVEFFSPLLRRRILWGPGVTCAPHKTRMLKWVPVPAPLPPAPAPLPPALAPLPPALAPFPPAPAQLTVLFSLLCRATIFVSLAVVKLGFVLVCFFWFFFFWLFVSLIQHLILPCCQHQSSVFMFLTLYSTSHALTSETTKLKEIRNRRLY